MQTFIADAVPSEGLLRQVRRRGLIIVGHLDEYMHPRRCGGPIRPWMVDENPVWVLDAREGPIWGSEPRFDRTLIEYGQDPVLVRETTVEEAAQVGLYHRDCRRSCYVPGSLSAAYLGVLDKDGREMFSVGAPSPIVIRLMVELASQYSERGASLRGDEDEEKEIRGLIRFLEGVLSDASLSEALPTPVWKECLTARRALSALRPDGVKH